MYRGVWGVYPNLPSGRILISDRTNGLYLLDFVPPPEVHSTSDFLVFPNPSSDYIYFVHSHIGNSDYTVEVFNLLGQKVATYNGDRDFLYIDISAYRAGLYLLKYSSNLSDTENVISFIKR